MTEEKRGGIEGENQFRTHRCLYSGGGVPSQFSQKKTRRGKQKWEMCAYTVPFPQGELFIQVVHKPLKCKKAEKIPPQKSIESSFLESLANISHTERGFFKTLSCHLLASHVAIGLYFFVSSAREFAKKLGHSG